MYILISSPYQVFPGIWKTDATGSELTHKDTSAAENYTCEVDPPSQEEVCHAIRQLRNSRAPGEDGIPAEVYKMCLDSLGP